MCLEQPLDFCDYQLMSRKLRVQYPGAIYHVMSRGDRGTRFPQNALQHAVPPKRPWRSDNLWEGWHNADPNIDNATRCFQDGLAGRVFSGKKTLADATGYWICLIHYSNISKGPTFIPLIHAPAFLASGVILMMWQKYQLLLKEYTPNPKCFNEID